MFYILLLALLPASALAEYQCPWTEFEFLEGTDTPAPGAVEALRKQMAEVTELTGKVRLYGYLPEDAKGAGEATSLFEARTTVIRKYVTEFLLPREGWILASEELSDTDAPTKRSHRTIDVEFHGYDDPEVHDFDTIDRKRPIVDYTAVPIRYVLRSTPLYPAGRRELQNALGDRDPQQVYVRVTAHAETREAKGSALQRMSDERLRQVVLYLRELGIPEENFMLTHSYGGQVPSGQPMGRLVLVTFLEKDTSPVRLPKRPAAPTRKIASYTSPTSTQSTSTAPRERPESGWQGQFGVASGSRLFMVGVSAEKRIFPQVTLGGTLGQVERLGGTVDNRSRVFLFGATVTGYLFESTWEGPWAKFTLLNSFYNFRGYTGSGEFSPGFRTDIGISVQRGLPFTIRAALGAQYLSRSHGDGEVGGWSPTLTVELGFNW